MAQSKNQELAPVSGDRSFLKGHVCFLLLNDCQDISFLYSVYFWCVCVLVFPQCVSTQRAALPCLLCLDVFSAPWLPPSLIPPFLSSVVTAGQRKLQTLPGQSPGASRRDCAIYCLRINESNNWQLGNTNKEKQELEFLSHLG